MKLLKCFILIIYCLYEGAWNLPLASFWLGRRAPSSYEIYSVFLEDDPGEAAVHCQHDYTPQTHSRDELCVVEMELSLVKFAD